MALISMVAKTMISLNSSGTIMTETTMMEARWDLICRTKGMNPRFYEKNLNAIGMKRIGTPLDVARVALFLASDLSEYVTGQTIGVDGGMII